MTASVDGLRTFTFTAPTAVSTGQMITATRVSTHDTSEFPAPKMVASPYGEATLEHFSGSAFQSQELRLEC